MRDWRLVCMRPRPAARGTAILAAATLFAACGGSGGQATPTQAAGTPAGTKLGAPADTGAPGATAAASGGAGGALTEDAAHQVIVVNLHLANGAAGPAFDVYQVSQNPQGLTPAVAGLAYGSASSPVHPGRISTTGTGDFAVGYATAGSTDVSPLPPITGDWQLRIDAIGGSGSSPSFFEFYREPGDSGSVPVPPAGQVSLLASTVFVGDPNEGSAPAPGSVMFGTAGRCLPSSAPAYAGDAADPAGQATAYQVPGGTGKVGFWISSAAQPGPGDCAGAPVAEADVSGLAAGSRAIVFLYGPTVATAKVLVLPIP